MVAELTGQNYAPAQHKADADARAQGRFSPWVWIFVIGLVTPLFIQVGPMRLTPYRLALLVAFFPVLFYWLGGRAGRIRLADICVVGICLWSSLSFSVVHGFGAMYETIGIFWVETLGAYLLGRCYIRTPETFHAIVRLLFRLSLVMIPFTIYEMITAEDLILTLFSKIGPTYHDNPMEPRLGFDRVQGPFPHQIHFGVFFLCLSGVVYYVLGYGLRWTRRVGQMLVVAFVGATSLSSGPLVALMAQLNVIIWDGMMTSVRQRWHIFAALAAVGFVVVDFLSNRTPFHVVVEYLALNKETAYNRIRIWQFGTDNIFAYPLFGNGFNDWMRPYWMSDSVDMFWIIGAMRHGIPVWILWFMLFFSIFLAVAYRQGLSERVGWYRTGYVITLFGLFMAGWTVHYWDVTYAFFMFLLGAGVWFLDWEGEEDSGVPAVSKPTELVYTRFPKGGTALTTSARLDPAKAVKKGGAERLPKGAPRSLRQEAAQRARP